MSEDYIPTSPILPTPDGIVRNAREFSGAFTLDLTDEEIARAHRIIVTIKGKWQNYFRMKFNDHSTFSLDDALEKIEEFEDELKTTLAEHCNILASVNTVPLIEGAPMEIEILGKIPGDTIYKYGLDHERKTHEVQLAKERGEDFLGQKG